MIFTVFADYVHFCEQVCENNFRAYGLTLRTPLFLRQSLIAYLKRTGARKISQELIRPRYPEEPGPGIATVYVLMLVNPHKTEWEMTEERLIRDIHNVILKNGIPRVPEEYLKS